jgi:hypothetical protein
MSRRKKQSHWRSLLTRREFFGGPIKWLKNGPMKQLERENIPGRIPLDSLKDLPTGVLMRMVPVLRRGWRAHVNKKGLFYQDVFGQEGVVRLRRKARAAVRQFDGIRSLEQVAETLETEFGITPVRSSAVVRKAFLKLAMREIYHPNTAIDPMQTHQKMERQHA